MKKEDTRMEESLAITGINSYHQTMKMDIPLLAGAIPAGFPSSAENFIDKSLDLNELVIKHPAATFFVRVKGNSMIKAGIESNDILVVDRALSVSNNRIVIARIADELTVKRIKLEGEKLFLMPDNDEYKPMEITESMDFEVWGVVTFVIHQV